MVPALLTMARLPCIRMPSAVDADGDSGAGKVADGVVIIDGNDGGHRPSRVCRS